MGESRGELQITAFILAGGASRRMGAPKHELILGGETLLARMLRQARHVARRLVVLGPPESIRALDSGFWSALGLQVLHDDLPRRGPLGAIYTGLSHTRTEFNLFLSCDLPFIGSRFLRHLALAAHDSQADVTLARTPREGYQPLAAIYRRRALNAVRVSLLNDRNKVTGFLPKVQVRCLEWPELARAGFQLSIFDNLNTKADYDRAARKINGSGNR